MNQLKKNILLFITLIRNPAAYLIFRKMKSFTMLSPYSYMKNLLLARRFKKTGGAVVECGTWRGGMIAGIAMMLGGGRDYFLFDSFEGLPQAKEIDGQQAIDWQQDTSSEKHYDNCRAEMSFAETAMKKSGVGRYKIIKGWFSESLPNYNPADKIAILRLDGDWYDSTMECLTLLYPYVVKGGVVIIDDYFTWDGCARAVHDFISRNNLTVRISQYDNAVCYWVKN